LVIYLQDFKDARYHEHKVIIIISGLL